MKVTLVADASYQDGTEQAGWAAAVQILDEQLIQFSGTLSNVRNSTFAELAALGNAICNAISRGRLKRGDRLTAYSDCEHAVSLLDGRKPAKGIHKDDLKIIDMVNSACITSGVILITKHVKGHSKASDMVSQLNEWCDLAAKAANTLPVKRPVKKCLPESRV